MTRAAAERAADYLRERLAALTTGGDRAIARLYRTAQGQILAALRSAYDAVFGDAEEVTYTRAAEVGLESLIRQAAHQATDDLNAGLDGELAERMADVMYAAVEDGAKALGMLDVPDVTVPELGLDDVATVLRVGWGGATAADRIFHMTDQLKSGLVGNLRTGLLNQESYEDLRGRVTKMMGLGDAPQPPYSLYGSVKTWRNEAKHAWGVAQQKVHAANADSVKRVWRSMLLDVTTPDCAANHGLLIDEELDGWDPLSDPPHPNSFPPETLVEAEAVAGFRRLYQGRMLRIKTRQGYTLAITPKHPVLTPSGLRPAYLLQKGDDVVSCLASAEGFSQKEQNAPAQIQQVFEALRRSGGGHRIAVVTPEDFHGDTVGGKSEVDIITVNRELLDYLADPTALERFRKFPFELADTEQPLHARSCASDAALVGVLGSASRGPGVLEQSNDIRFSRIRRKRAPEHSLSVGHTAHWHSVFSDTLAESQTVNTAFVRQLLNRLPGKVTLDQVVEIREQDFSGHVFDLQSVSGLIIAQNIITSNCLCDILYLSADEGDAEDVDAILAQMAAEQKAWFKAYGEAETAKAARKASTRKEGFFVYRLPAFREAFDPAKHPRAPAGGKTGGEFTSGGGAAVKGRVFSGHQIATKTSLSKQATGALGEQLVLSWLRGQGAADVRPLNAEHNNFPIDLVHDHEAVEVKAGLVSNRPDAQKWRLTIGEPGPAEAAWLATAPAAQKAALNAGKEQAIVARKQLAMREIAKERGTRRLPAAVTIAVIINPDTHQADLFRFSGFHASIRWRSPETEKAYVGTIRY